jgi:hypothetical protein
LVTLASELVAAITPGATVVENTGSSGNPQSREDCEIVGVVLFGIGKVGIEEFLKFSPRREIGRETLRVVLLVKGLILPIIRSRGAVEELALGAAAEGGDEVLPIPGFGWKASAGRAGPVLRTPRLPKAGDEVAHLVEKALEFGIQRDGADRGCSLVAGGVDPGGLRREML